MQQSLGVYPTQSMGTIALAVGSPPVATAGMGNTHKTNKLQGRKFVAATDNTSNG